MEYFLEQIAGSIKEEFGSRLNRHCLVFPGRRAGLYFLKYLSQRLEKPVWAPATYTINELFRSMSDLQVAGSELLLFELYKAYRAINKDAGAFDDFYFWGDMLINDFDDADKYIADTSGLFSNVKDLREIDLRFDGLTEEQKEIIKRFWYNFDISRPTEQKSGFTGLWSIMNDLYRNFREELRKKNLAYEGMIFRDISEWSDDEIVKSVDWDVVHFIGFNALNNCEKRLMGVLKKAGKARFYWDYDNSYIGKGNHNSAGFFMNENLELFGNNMPEDWNYNTMISQGTEIKRVVIETSSDVGQVKLVPDLLARISDLNNENAHHTAVILSDETLLVPLLSSLPVNSVDVNITMGYPLKQSLVYTLVKSLMDLQRTARVQDNSYRFHSPHVLNIIRHPLIADMLDPSENSHAGNISSSNKAWFSTDEFTSSGLLSRIFVKHTKPALLSEWFREILSLISLKSGSNDDQTQLNIRNEMIYRIVLSINRLEAIVNNPEITFSSETWLHLFDKLLRGHSVPFSGEPLSGIQIMGILETRALDFKNLIILSVNEGVMPAISSSSSFIPFSLRQAFGLPSLNHQESIFAYHFYRLLHRAENVTFVYNSNSEGLRSGEMSRFLIQMNYDDKLRPEFRNTGALITTAHLPEESVSRTEEHIRLLENRFVQGDRKVLSPSAINSWLNCRMKFCYKYVNGIYEPETISEDIDAAMFGNILHGIMKCLYQDYSGKVLTTKIIEDLIRNEDRLHKVINETISKELHNGEDNPVTGGELIVHDVLFTYVKRILHIDKSFSPLTILQLEEYSDFNIEARSGSRKIRVRTGGYADRIDRINDRIRLIDYKTGTISESICSVDDLFEEDRAKESDGWLQVLLYCESFMQKNPGVKISPSVYKIKKMTGKSFNDTLVIKEGKTECRVDDYTQIRAQYNEGLRTVVERIFNPDEPFTMTANASKCKYCAYKTLCSR